MRGFDSLVWLVVVIQAGGGLLIAVVVRYADNIMKAFATSIAIIFSAAISFILFALVPRALFVAGTALVLSAVTLYSLFPKRAPVVVVVADEPPTIAMKANERDFRMRAAARDEADAVWDAISLKDDKSPPPPPKSRV